MEKSKLDTLKLREMITLPELPNPMEAVMKQTMDGLHKKEMEVIEDILRHHIDCPIEGKLTREKVKAAHIRGVMYSDNFPQLKADDNGKDICISVTSGLMGVVQGDWLIGAGGARRPLTEKERDYYERQERQDLHLALKHEWFVAFKEGDKPVEFREITAHWTKRLMEPTEYWPSDKRWDDLYGKHLDRDTLLANIYYGIRKDYIRYKKFGDMVLKDGYPSKDDADRHFRIGWFGTDIGCVKVPRWAWPGTPADKKFFRIWSNKVTEPYLYAGKATANEILEVTKRFREILKDKED